MKKNLRKSSVLILTMMIAFSMLLGTSSVFAEGGSGENIGKITLNWHHYDTGKGYYNPADEGKDVSFWYIFGFKGKDKNGNMQSGLYAQRMYNGKIGETKVDKIDLSSVKDQKGDTYTDCEFQGFYLPLYEGGNTKYGVSLDEKAKEITVEFDQNMETHTKMSIEEGAIIFEEDMNDMQILFDVEKVGGEYPHKNTQNSNVIKRTVNFKEGDLYLSLDDGRDAYSFYRAISGNNLGMFNPYTQHKNEYKIHANFTGNRKAELEERYSLAMSGNDLDGWNLVLKSNIKKGVKKEVTNQDFETIYEDDPTLPVGKTKVKQKGVKGKTVTKTTYYYIAKEDGKEKIIKTEDPIVEKTEPVNKIVLRGTKKVAAENQNPMTGDTGSMIIYMSSLFMAILGSYVLVKTRKKADK